MSEYDDPWTTDLAEMVVFAGVLVRADRLDSAANMLYYFEKPHRFSPEHQLWVDAGRPDLDDDGWELFVHRLDKADL